MSVNNDLSDPLSRTTVVAGADTAHFQDGIGSDLAPELIERVEQNEGLKGALVASGLPIRFQAMVLGLAALKQMNDDDT